MSGFYTPARFRGSSAIPGRRLRKAAKRDCQRCGRSFVTHRDVPYCAPCFREKHAA